MKIIICRVSQKIYVITILKQSGQQPEKKYKIENSGLLNMPFYPINKNTKHFVVVYFVLKDREKETLLRISKN